MYPKQVPSNVQRIHKITITVHNYATALSSMSAKM